MLDYAIGFIVNNIWIWLFAIAAVYNYWSRPDHTPAFDMAVIFSAIFAISHIVYVQWILSFEKLDKVYYLYWACISGLAALALFVSQRIRKNIIHWPIGLAISLSLIEVLFNLAVHLDRNVVALNGALSPNNSIESAWWLWDVRNIVLNSNNFIVLACLFLPFSLFSRQTPIDKFFSSDSLMDKAFSRISKLEDLVIVMPEGLQKQHAWQCLVSAEFLLMQWEGDGEDRSHLYSANILCDRARILALCNDEAIDIELYKYSEDRIKIE
ncbi:hypothetical protein KIH87_02805 [Paraneptunicella aestuarii]|uniref:hypothetical protein n=1 Tax=Paraneptunicella aestuarii TaxID=2831148 RepID=UPI001E564675|nr:hypothetical protein [Paraneptunicella aestuarii]UAA39311.1 hypothetical protein KIH87_02805 [Paraneptunicella aestuarii]